MLRFISNSKHLHALIALSDRPVETFRGAFVTPLQDATRRKSSWLKAIIEKVSAVAESEVFSQP